MSPGAGCFRHRAGRCGPQELRPHGIIAGMPSPLGHMLGGAIAGGVVSGRRLPLGMLAVFAAAGAAPDLDLVFGSHSGPTHGLGSALIAGGAAWVLWSTLLRRHGGVRIATAVAAAYASHALLDWLSTDTSPPIGIMALWPLSTEHYLSPYSVFLPLLRRYSGPEFWLINLRAVIRELLILGPLFLIVWWPRGERRPAGLRLSDDRGAVREPPAR